MAYTLDDYRREYVLGGLHLLTPEEVIAGLTPEEVIASFTPEERMSGLTPEDILASLTPKDREWFTKALLSEQHGGNQARDES